MAEVNEKRAKGKKPLTQRQSMLVEFYLAGATKVDSMRMSGYTESQARHNTRHTFGSPVVVAEIKRQQMALREKYELDEDWVIQRLMRIANSGEILAKFKVVEEDGSLSWNFTDATEDELAAINELSISYSKDGKKQMKIGAESPKGALDSLCRKLGMFQDIQINIGEVSLSDRISRGRERSRVAYKAGDDAKVVNP